MTPLALRRIGVSSAAMDWRIHLHRDGYVMFSGLCPQPIVRAARAAIDQDLTTNYDAHRQLEYDNRSYCPRLRGTAELLSLLLDSGITAKLNEVLGSRDIEQRRWHLMTHIWDGWETAGISPT